MRKSSPARIVSSASAVLGIKPELACPEWLSDWQCTIALDCPNEFALFFGFGTTSEAAICHFVSSSQQV